MHVIRSKHKREVLYIDPSASKAPLPAARVYAGFDPSTMEIGWTDQSYIPIHFDIDKRGHVIPIAHDEAARLGLRKLAATEKLEDGKVVQKTQDELVKGGQIDLDELKASLIAAINVQALQLRAAIIPEYKLQNAAIGVYDAPTVARYRATIEGFRAEVHRLEAEVSRAQTASALQRLKPKFPKRILEAKKS